MGECRGAAGTARFVGVRDYKASGGTITRDLFAGNHDPGSWFDDGKILHDLAHKKLSKTRRTLSPGWKWSEVHPEFGYDQLRKFDEMDQTPDDFTAKEAARLDAIRKELETVEDSSGVRDWELNHEIDKINYAARERGHYTAEQMAVSGCVVTLDPQRQAPGTPRPGQARGPGGGQLSPSPRP